MSAASTFAAASSCMCGNTCEYTSNVKAALVCPSCSDTTFGETPTVKAKVAAVCRRSYSLMFGNPALFKIGLKVDQTIHIHGPSKLRSNCQRIACLMPARKTAIERGFILELKKWQALCLDSDGRWLFPSPVTGRPYHADSIRADYLVPIC